MNAKFALDISSLIATNKPVDPTSKKQQLASWKTKCQEFEQQVLTIPYEDLVQGKLVD